VKGLANEYWRKSPKKGKPQKIVFDLNTELLYKCDILELSEQGKTPLNASRRLLELMRDDVPGEITKFSVGSNGDSREGYMIRDLFGRKYLHQPVAKAYPVDGFVRVVHPSKLGKKYITDMTGMYGKKYVRRLV
jgi:hypothetical protein